MQSTHGPLVARLARANPAGVFLVALALVLVGLLVPGVVGGALLLLLGAALVALLRLTWRVQTPVTRVIRLLMVTLLVAVALTKLL